MEFSSQQNPKFVNVKPRSTPLVSSIQFDWFCVSIRTWQEQEAFWRKLLFTLSFTFSCVAQRFLAPSHVLGKSVFSLRLSADLLAVLLRFSKSYAALAAGCTWCKHFSINVLLFFFFFFLTYSKLDMSKFDPDSEERPKQNTEKSHDSLHSGVWKLEGEKSGTQEVR